MILLHDTQPVTRFFSLSACVVRFWWLCHWQMCPCHRIRWQMRFPLSPKWDRPVGGTWEEKFGTNRGFILKWRFVKENKISRGSKAHAEKRTMLFTSRDRSNIRLDRGCFFFFPIVGTLFLSLLKAKQSLLVGQIEESGFGAINILSPCTQEVSIRGDNAAKRRWLDYSPLF